MILDEVSLQFAVDFANVVLRSYVNDLIEKAAKAKMATQVKPAVATPVPPTPPPAPKSSIILTD